MLEVVLATRNRYKEREYRDLLKVHGIRLLPLSALPNSEKIKIVESGNTFKENAMKKATVVAKVTNKFVLADDSGLEVDVINGRPGVFSSRFAGVDATDHDNVNLLLRMLRGVPPKRRGARYHCVVALAWPGGAQVSTSEGLCEGAILEHPRGDGGFGYDPVFYLEKRRCSMAELSLEEKNRISHRFQALEKMKSVLGEIQKNNRKSNKS